MLVANNPPFVGDQQLATYLSCLLSATATATATVLLATNSPLQVCLLPHPRTQVEVRVGSKCTVVSVGDQLTAPTADASVLLATNSPLAAVCCERIVGGKDLCWRPIPLAALLLPPCVVGGIWSCWRRRLLLAINPLPCLPRIVGGIQYCWRPIPWGLYCWRNSVLLAEFCFVGDQSPLRYFLSAAAVRC